MGGPGSGGSRTGSGKKKTARDYGDAFRLKLSKTIAKKAKETGKGLEEVLIDMVYDDGAMLTARVGALKQVIDVLVPKTSIREVNQSITHSGPLILPELAPLSEPPKPKMPAPEELN